MNLRNALIVAGLATAIAVPATGAAQFYSPYGYYGPTYYYSVPSYGYGYGPFGTPSYIPGPSGYYYGGSYGRSRPLRVGGATVYFGGSGGYRNSGGYRGYRPGNHLYRPHGHR